MVSNKEIKIALESKRIGVDQEFLQMMEVPFEWTGNSYLFDFDSMTVEKLSLYVDFLFKQQGYRLEEGYTVNNVYYKYDESVLPNVSAYLLFFLSPLYKFEVEINSSGGKTYLEIFKIFNGRLMSFQKLIYGKNYPNSELNIMADKIKLLRLSSNSYLVCNACGEYYELQEGESPDELTDRCECGGNLKYIPKQLDIDEPPKKRMLNEHSRRYWAVLVLVIFFVWLLLLNEMFKPNAPPILTLFGIILFVILIASYIIYVGEFIY